MCFLDRYYTWIDRNEARINTWANHLIVIFAFSMPLMISVRRLSIVLIVLLFLVRGKFLYHIRRLMSDPVLLSLTLYFSIHIFWTIGSDDAELAKKSIHDASFLLFAPLFVSFIDKRFVDRIMLAFILGMIVSVLVSFGIFFGLVPPMPHDITQGVPSDPTPLYHHTHYGYMLAVTAIILLKMFLNEGCRGYARTLTGFAFSMVIIDMFIIEGRSGYILFVMLLVAFILFKYRRKAAKPLLISFVMIFAAAFSAYHTVDTFKNRIDLTINSSKEVMTEENYNTSIGGRVGMLVYSLDVISKQYLLGYGTGDHASVVSEVVKKENRRLSTLVGTLQHPHNEYINALIQFGVIGLLLFLNIPYQMLRYSAGEDGLVLKVLAISILFYTLIDVFIIGLGMLLTVVLLTSTQMKNYYIENTHYKGINTGQILMYGIVIAVFYSIKTIVP